VHGIAKGAHNEGRIGAQDGGGILLGQQGGVVDRQLIGHRVAKGELQ
jgi:hypothetical protein